MVNISVNFDKIVGNIKPMHAVASKLEDKKAIIISNVKESEVIKTNLSNDFSVYVLDKENFIVKTSYKPSEFTLKENEVVLIKNY